MNEYKIKVKITEKDKWFPRTWRVVEVVEAKNGKEAIDEITRYFEEVVGDENAVIGILDVEKL